MPQPQSRQQSQFNEIQMLQRQIMLKQLQELQRQKKLQELNDARQKNVVNQQSLIHNKQASGGQYSPLNGTPVRDASQMFMFGNANLVQGFPNGLVYSQSQNQVLHSMGFASQQLDGTPVSSTGNSFSQYSHFQEVSHEPTGALTKHSSEQAEKVVTQSSISKSFMNNQFNVSSNQERNLFGPVFTQGSDIGGQTGNIDQVNNHRNASLQQFGGGQEQSGWPGHFSEKPTNASPSQGLATLDPLEQKILFNMDDNSWGSSFGKHGNMGTGGFQNMFENTENSSTFPSIQSGSWSALMQSAVAEASSSDTGLQEEWSGLSFQNPEHSNDNQPSNFVESGKHPTPWLDNNLQNASSLSPKLELVSTSNASSSFPGFQHYPVTPFQFPNKEDMRADASHESIHHSPKEVGKRLDCSIQQRESLEENTPGQRFSLLQSAWPGKNYEHLQSDSPQQSLSVCNNDFQPLEYVNHSDRRSKTMTNDHPQPCNNPVSESIQKQSGQVHQQLSGYHQGHAGEFTFVNNESNSSRDFKGFLPDIQRKFKASEEATFRSNDCSGMLEGSAGSPPPNSTTQTSHHMLELLHKVDRFREYRTGMHSGYTDSAPTTEGPKAEHADASTPSYSHSSASQYFGLRLAPPTQRPPVANYFDSAQISQQSCLPTKAIQSHQYDNNQLQNQNSLANHSPQATVSGIGNRYPVFSHDVSQEASHVAPVNQDGQFSIQESKKVVQGLATSGITQQAAFSTRPPNVWVDVPAQQNPSGMGSHVAASGSPSTSDAANSRMETASEAPKELYYQNHFNGENDSLETGADVMNSQDLDGREQAGKIFSAEESLTGSSEANAPSSVVQGSGRVQHSGSQSPVISARDLEAFGRSLKQAHVAHHNYSLLNPMHSNPSVRAATRTERVDSDTKIPQATSVSYLNSYGNIGTQPVPSVASGDQLVKNPSQAPLSNPSQVTVTYKKDGFHQPPSNNVASNLTERSEMNFPMPPSWFKNAQMLPMYGARVANNTAQQLLVGRPSESFHTNPLMQVNLAVASQYGSIWPTSGTNSIPLTHSSSPYVLHSDGPNQDSVNLKSKKRKLPTLELLPWHKEVTEGCARLQDISTAELEWAQAANRLPEKLKEESEALGDSLPMVHRKKRLTLATQLMQLLFRPAPAVILSEDATAHYDIITYFTARLALGDACSLGSHSHMSRDISDSSSGRSINSKSSGIQDLSKTVEDLIDRSKRLESEISRLESRGSIVDIRVECREIEKFSLFNRLTKFHSRGLLVAAEAAASGGTSTVPKFSLQRYVTASPMRTVPEGHNCLLL